MLYEVITAVLEGTQLAALDELLQPVLNVAEVTGRRLGMIGRDLHLQLGSRLGIGLQRISYNFV